MQHTCGLMYEKQTKMRDEIVKERLGLGNTNSSPNLNINKFWPVGRSTPTRTLLIEMRGGET